MPLSAYFRDGGGTYLKVFMCAITNSCSPNVFRLDVFILFLIIFDVFIFSTSVTNRHAGRSAVKNCDKWTYGFSRLRNMVMLI